LKLPLFRPTFNLPQAIIYNTEAERQMVNAVMQNDDPAQIVAGVGINVPDEASAQRFRQQFGIDEPFMLYVGRVDRAKNVPELLAFFARFKQENPMPLKLVLIGRETIPQLNHPDIIYLGFQPEQVKFDAIAASEMVIMPSLYESLSMIALEAWWMEKPMIVNGRCEILKQQCRRSNAGLYYQVYDEFEVILKKLLSNTTLREKLGRQGHHFVAHNYHWDVILAKYKAVIETLF
jgi:glycosyltransferase involved in cell wall biosynthesis